MASKMMSTLVRRSVCGVGLQCDDREASDDHEQCCQTTAMQKRHGDAPQSRGVAPPSFGGAGLLMRSVACWREGSVVRATPR